MDVGQHGKAEAVADLGKNRQRGFQPDAPRGGARGAVGLVERGLEDQPYFAPSRDLLQRARHLERVGAALELARPRDHAQRQLGPESHRTGAVADFDIFVGHGNLEGFAANP